MRTSEHRVRQHAHDRHHYDDFAKMCLCVRTPDSRRTRHVSRHPTPDTTPDTRHSTCRRGGKVARQTVDPPADLRRWDGQHKSRVVTRKIARRRTAARSTDTANVLRFRWTTPGCKMVDTTVVRHPVRSLVGGATGARGTDRHFSRVATVATCRRTDAPTCWKFWRVDVSRRSASRRVGRRRLHSDSGMDRQTGRMIPRSEAGRRAERDRGADSIRPHSRPLGNSLTLSSGAGTCRHTKRTPPRTSTPTAGHDGRTP